MKRIGDILIAFILIVFTLPLISIVALAIKLDSPGPILSRKERLGFGGRRCDLLKFRATVHKPQHAEAIRVEDAQVTRVGWFLRWTRIDDLPKLVNVLRGELTLIGTGRNRPDFIDWP